MRRKDGDLGRCRANFDVRKNKVGQWPNSNNQRVYPSSTGFSLLLNALLAFRAAFRLVFTHAYLSKKGEPLFFSKKLVLRAVAAAS
jgi:hypothetical protein